MSIVIERSTVDEMVASVSAYLPGGELYQSAQITDTNFNALLMGISGELLRAENFLFVYNSEFLPDNNVTFLEEWESALGIPDECFLGTGDAETRRLHVLVKLASLGVQTTDDFEALAAIMGFPGTIVLPGVVFGITPIEDARFTIVVVFQVGIDNIFPMDFPLPFGDEEFLILECLFNKLKPANCQLEVAALTIDNLVTDGGDQIITDSGSEIIIL